MVKRYGDARMFLEELEEAKAETVRLRRGVRNLEERCTRTTGSYGFGGRGGGPTREELLAELCDKRQELLGYEKDLRQREEQIEQLVAQLPNPRWRMVMRSHYLDGLPLPQVAQELTMATGTPFSMHQIYRLHSAALSAVEESLQSQ